MFKRANGVVRSFTEYVLSVIELCCTYILGRVCYSFRCRTVNAVCETAQSGTEQEARRVEFFIIKKKKDAFFMCSRTSVRTRRKRVKIDNSSPVNFKDRNEAHGRAGNLRVSFRKSRVSRVLVNLTPSSVG